MIIIQVFRKKNPLFFSIETVFNQVRQAWNYNDSLISEVLPVNGISFANILYLRKKYQPKKECVFHITGDVHYVVLGLPSKRTILTVHDSVFIKQHNGIKRWVLKMILLKMPIWYVGVVTTISEKSKEEIIALTGCKPEKINVIPNPVSDYIYYKQERFNSNCPTFLFVGNTPNKNLERVVEAIKGIACKLSIIGKLSDEQIGLLKSHNIKYDAVHGISNEEIAIKYSQADVVLFPSLYEGFGLPIIEGFKAGRVVITSKLAPMQDIASDAACLVDPYNIQSIRDGILQVIQNNEYRSRLIENGFEVVKQYQPSAIAEKYFHLFQKVYNQTCVV
jgi:glycosyltransferase involved in cell wall biosynthesis